MKNIISTLVVASALFASCQNTSTKTTTTTDSTMTTSVDHAKNADQCFEYIKNRDTANLKLVEVNDSISGDLSYNFYEKDKNNGTISGIVKGDTLIADYTFNSEGSKSVRQVVWLKKDGKLLEGFGDIEETDGKMRFKNISQLSFTNALQFNPVECK
ncbi:hypothetical protein DHW03_12070 [Pedobacter yonginense]|uniref:Lipoprotein n=1 Tax=Pedobacter yonginense TaxID=651869 RepID=A0A317EIT4_9SPHI|nr:hypothetical protein [Pedobacter yonginense]PWS26761.1 hypothetical protein DHW03_12070 [Pedobacter yonginense]